MYKRVQHYECLWGKIVCFTGPRGFLRSMVRSRQQEVILPPATLIPVSPWDDCLCSGAQPVERERIVFLPLWSGYFFHPFFNSTSSLPAVEKPRWDRQRLYTVDLPDQNHSLQANLWLLFLLSQPSLTQRPIPLHVVAMVTLKTFPDVSRKFG